MTKSKRTPEQIKAQLLGVAVNQFWNDVVHFAKEVERLREINTRSDAGECERRHLAQAIKWFDHYAKIAVRAALQGEKS